MRSIAFIAGLAALAVASPVPQDSDDLGFFDLPIPDDTVVPIGAGNETTTPVNTAALVASAVADVLANSLTDDNTSAKRSLERRGACSPQPVGYGPTSPQVADDPTSFQNYGGFSTAAQNAQTPSGYVNTFTNYKASVTTCGYMGYKTYSSYDVNQASLDCNKIAGCKGFNIFFERDPSVDPGAGCSTPSSTTVIKASFWGNTVGPATATNSGQYRAGFQVVIAGSNAYNVEQCPTPITGFNQNYLGECTIHAPATSCSQGQPDSYLGSQTFKDAILDHSRCKAICDTFAQRNSADACNFFTSYMLVTNGKCGVQQCGFYKRAWTKDAGYCTETGQVQGSNTVSIKWASSFTNANDDGVYSCPVTSQRSMFRL